MIFREKLQFCLEIKTCDPLNYTMDHSKLIASIQKEEFISSFKSSAQALKIALVRSYLRVPQAAGQVKILIFLV